MLYWILLQESHYILTSQQEKLSSHLWLRRPQMTLGKLPWAFQFAQPIPCCEGIPIVMAWIGGPSTWVSWITQHSSIIPETHTSNSFQRHEEDSGGKKYPFPSSPTVSLLWVDSDKCEVMGQRGAKLFIVQEFIGTTGPQGYFECSSLVISSWSLVEECSQCLW